jgi:exonuclease VII small subunit
MDTAQNDSNYTPLPVEEVFEGFEMAVADYESGRSSLDTSRLQLERAQAQLEHAELTLDEADAQLEVIVMAFNASTPQSPDYPELMIELDIATANMLEATEQCEALKSQCVLAHERYQSELASSEETYGVATALCAELSRSLDGLQGLQASNDPHYSADEVLSSLSDTAYRFFRDSA